MKVNSKLDIYDIKRFTQFSAESENVSVKSVRYDKVYRYLILRIPNIDLLQIRSFSISR
jgi:hypothetical protein